MLDIIRNMIWMHIYYINVFSRERERRERESHKINISLKLEIEVRKKNITTHSKEVEREVL